MQINFAASDDETGNMCGGGDWVMESDGTLDIADTYWDLEILKEYKETMFGWWDVLDCVPLVGGVARSTQAAVLMAAGDKKGAEDAAKNAAMNFAGDALGLATGGAGKVAATAARTGAKIAIKKGVKAGVKAGVKKASKAMVKVKRMPKLTKDWMIKTSKRRFKKKIKKEAKKAVKDLVEEGKEMVREELEFRLEEATGITVSELRADSDDTLMALAECVIAADQEFMA
jgi:hypothetical protein